MTIVPLPQTDAFEAFWKLYPRRVGKLLAQTKWEAITRGGLHTWIMDKDSGQRVPVFLKATAAEILAGTKRFRDGLYGSGYELKVEERFIPHASTWLNQGRWLD